MEDKKKPLVEARVEVIDEELLQSKNKKELIGMVTRSVEALDALKLILMEATVWAERNIRVIHELNAQLKIKDLWIEAVIETIGRDKITIPDGMVLYSGDDYVNFWEDGDKVDLSGKAKGDLIDDSTINGDGK